MIDKRQFISGVLEKYDGHEELFEGRLTDEGNVCGCLLSDLTYYDDAGLEVSDFLTKHGRLLFSLGKQIRDKGFSTFDEITLLSNTNSEMQDKIDNELGGWRQIQNVIDAVSIKNWDAFLDNLNRANVVLALYKKGFNVLNEITLDNGKKIVPLKLFNRMSCGEVVEFYESTLAGLETKVNSSKIVEEAYIDFDEEFTINLIAS